MKKYTFKDNLFNYKKKQIINFVLSIAIFKSFYKVEILWIKILMIVPVYFLLYYVVRIYIIRGYIIDEISIENEFIKICFQHPVKNDLKLSLSEIKLKEQKVKITLSSITDNKIIGIIYKERNQDEQVWQNLLTDLKC